MKKKLTLLFIFLLMLGLFTSYRYLTEKITAGNLKITAGDKQIKEGEQMLAQGKAKLSNSQRQLSQAKNGYHDIKAASYLSMIATPIAGGLFAMANKKIIGSKISEGKQLIANGQNKIKAGEDQLNTGKEALRLGKEQLKQAEKIRIACGIGAILCAVILIILGFSWRRKK